MMALGKKQFDAAKDLFKSAQAELTGSIYYGYTHIPISEITIGVNTLNKTFAAAIGISFGAGSQEDGTASVFVKLFGVNIAGGLNEGITSLNASIIERSASAMAFAGLGGKLAENPLPSSPWKLPQLEPLNGDFNAPSGARFIAGHAPKPIMFPVGNSTPHPLVPKVVPIQLLKIGQLVILGVPAEVTTMAGRRLKKTIKNIFGAAINDIAIAAYTNDYSGYITTNEEYNMQHYEGASTLYGPNTLAAYLQEFSKLAQKTVNGNSINTRVPDTPEAATLKHRGVSLDQIYVCNRTNSVASIRIFLTLDERVSYNWPHEAVPPNENLLFNVPPNVVFNVSVNNKVSSAYKGGEIIVVQ